MLNEPVRGVVPESGYFSLTGIEQMRTYLQRRLPRTPHAHLLGYRMTQATAGASVISMPISPWFVIYDDNVDLTATAELSTYVTAATVAPAGTALRPVTMSLRYLRPCTVHDESVIARGRVLHSGSTFTTVETLIEDSLGRGVAHATACVVAEPIEPPPPPLVRHLDAQVDEPVYGTADPPRRSPPPSGGATTLPPYGTFLGVELEEESSDRAVTTMPASGWFCNRGVDVEPGIVSAHSTITASMITAQIAGPLQRAVTFEVASSYLWSVPADGRPIRSTATVREGV